MVLQSKPHIQFHQKCRRRKYMSMNEQIIYHLCCQNQWFTGGSQESYGKLFQLCKAGEPVVVIARCIWLCSNDTFLHIKNEINKSGYVGY